MTRPRDRGFTFLELLVALTILSLILLAVAGVLTRTLDAQRRAEQPLDRQLTVQAVLGRIEEDLRGAFSLGPEERSFVGTKDRIDFVTAVESLVPAGQPSAPYNGVGYRLERDPRSSPFQALIRREQAQGDLWTGGTSQELYAWVTDLQFTFLRERPAESPKASGQVEEMETWDLAPAAGLPLAVRVRMTLWFPGHPGSGGTSLDPGEMSRVPVSRIFLVPAGGRLGAGEAADPTPSGAGVGSGQGPRLARG